MAGVLEGVKVVDFSQVFAGPALTKLMAELGAEIVKVELPPAGDLARGLPFLKDGHSAYFVQQNRGKRSVCVDVKHPDGRRLVAELLAAADVLVQNFSPGVIERLGFGYDALAETHPRLVMCSISAFGHEGELAHKPGFDGLAAAFTGILDMNGFPDRPPVAPGFSPGDYLGGVHGLAGVCAALFHRERTGRGQHVRVSLVDCYINCHEVNVQMRSASGGAVNPTRFGAHHYIVCPNGTFRAPDGWIYFALPTDAMFAALCRAMGRPELAAEPRFASNVLRVEHQHELIPLVEAWLAEQGSAAAAMARLEAERVPAALVLSVAEAMAHPALRAQRTVRTVQDPVFGELDLPGVPIKLSEFPGEAELVAPRLGEHNRWAVTEALGRSEAEYLELAARGVLHAAPGSRED
ncbi:MAG: CaiB/BaiF CoA transferase family protein [Acidimicrobiales bacterium]